MQSDLTTKVQSLADREDFPSLSRTSSGCPAIYLDGPAGVQVPRQVIEAIGDYYRTCNANTHGAFETSQESDRLLEKSREDLAVFLGARSSRQISFGANMTTLTYALSHAISRHLTAGDEVVITQLDHEANRGPWLSLREKGIRVREVALRADGCLDYQDLANKLNENTRLVAMGLASNALGTVNDVAWVYELTRKVGAWLLVDAVHYAPHFLIDVSALGVDFLLCSAYKFYGPHIGILYCRENLLDQLDTDRLRTQDAFAPYRIETGTLNHAAIAGARAAVRYLASLGTGKSLRDKLRTAMGRVGRHERRLAQHLYDGLLQLPGVRVYGPPFEDGVERAPTISFTVEGLTARQVAERLGAKGIHVWDGDFYAIRPVEVLGLADRGGLVRVGIGIYNTLEEVDTLLKELETSSRK